MSTGKSAVAEYMKIRRHILNLVAKAGNESVQLPTALELSKQFGVCRQTVGKALKQLAEDHYVIGKPGLGTFTNPKKKFRFLLQKNARTIGIIIGDGMVIEMDDYLAKLVAACLVESSVHPSFVRTINLTSSKPDAVLKEVRNEALDGLIWQNPPRQFFPVLEEIRKTGTGVVVIGSRPPEKISSVNFDVRQIGYESGKFLLESGGKQFLILQDEYPWNLSGDGFREAFQETGIPLNEKLFLRGDSIREKLKLIFELGIPIDGIVNPLFFYDDLAEIANPAEFDLRRPLHVCRDTIAESFPEFHGFVYTFDFAALAKEAAVLLRKQMEKTDPEIYHNCIPTPVRPFEKIPNRSSPLS